MGEMANQVLEEGRMLHLPVWVVEQVESYR